MTPNYSHDCERCRYLGDTYGVKPSGEKGLIDLYLCRGFLGPIDTILLRFSGEACDTQECVVSLIENDTLNTTGVEHPAFLEAYLRSGKNNRLSLSFWCKSSQPGKEMLAHGAFADQMKMWAEIGGKSLPFVVSTHMSKSVHFPVVLYHGKNGRVMIRGNLHNYSITVWWDNSTELSSEDLKFLTSSLGYKEKVSAVYFEGFKEGTVLGSVAFFAKGLNDGFSVITWSLDTVNDIFNLVLGEDR